MKRNHHSNQGFTLIELLVVIGIVGILLSITLVAINPARQFRMANDTNRNSALNAISSAITQLIIDNKGSLPTTAGPFNLTSLSSATALRLSTSTGAGLTHMGSLCQMLTGQISVGSTGDKGVYISKLPYDPTTGSYTSCTTFDTGYSLYVSGGRVTISAMGEEPAVTLEVSR
ncbi:MAG: type II secretion system protein [Candidatus Roizmanbacteria bacterium]